MQVNRIWLISDTHFGCRSNSIEWLETMKDYFYNWFIPKLKSEYQEGDILFHCGDVFDNRQSLNIMVLNAATDIFVEISKILPVHIILGNHDTYKKSSNDINSLRIFEHFNNIHVYQEPRQFDIERDGKTKKILLMPWRAGPKEELECIDSNLGCDYLFCHTDFRGIKYNVSRDVEHGNDISNYEKFDKIFSGHIHYRQEIKNLFMVGCPYALTRSDINNKKGIYIFDPFENKEIFIENDYSPKFLKYKIKDILNVKLKILNKYVANNYIDLVTDQKWALDFPFTAFLENINGYKKINVISVLEEEQLDSLDSINDTDLSNFNILKLSKMYVENLNYSAKIKDLIIKKLEELYNKAQLN